MRSKKLIDRQLYFFIINFNYLKIVLTFIELSTHSCYMLHSVNMFILNEYDDDDDVTSHNTDSDRELSKAN